jgi:hypothetical protein
MGGHPETNPPATRLACAEMPTGLQDEFLQTSALGPAHLTDFICIIGFSGGDPRFREKQGLHYRIQDNLL